MKNRTHPSQPASLALLLLLAAGEASASERGLVLVPNVPLLVALIALFCILIFPLNTLIFRPIFRVFDEREERIAGAHRRAQQLATETDEIVAGYEKAVQEVREEAEDERRKSLEVARSEGASKLSGARSVSEREIEGARESIRTALEGARGSLRGEAESLARQAAERVLGRAL